MWQISIFGPGGVDPTTISPDSFYVLALKTFSMMVAVLGFVAVVYIIVGGIQYVMAAGNASEQSSAKKTVTYAVAGVIIALLSFVIVGEVLQRLSFNASV